MIAAADGVVLQACALGLRLQGQRIVDQVTLPVQRHEMLGLIGPNGSGKSSLLRLLAGVIQPNEGQVLLQGQPLQKMGRRAIARELALVAQMAETQDAISVEDAVALGRTPWLSALQPFSLQDWDAVQQALNAVGMEAKRHSAWHSLSGGERQRVHIARALAQQPGVLLLDEPCNHLDIHQQLSLMALIRALPVTKVVALHDLNQALACDRVAVMQQGRLVALGAPAQVLDAALLAQVFRVEASTLVDPWDGSRVLRFRPLSSS
ncbi:ABC transporter ATP-binding protein [Comamonas piscis]|uniref:ABC transporter ATP-binding protein n=1 Tax=Comamonas piscis TaxID=1562974 RepID=A0A7G5EBR5_9BURK|nr:ABC transporter ATP-binding protein [Comamonas piscis]QMV71440.1 ABC transporter ATP-binding protein [Comamonas piscis]WSO34149.1 ABC transporter ATP-binding protein [Comamonas piscis]